MPDVYQRLARVLCGSIRPSVGSQLLPETPPSHNRRLQQGWDRGLRVTGAGRPRAARRSLSGRSDSRAVAETTAQTLHVA